jgi:ClpP class serine protease
VKYHAVSAAFYNTPHAVTPEKLAEVRAFLERKFELPRAQDRFDDAQEDGTIAGPRDRFQMVGRVAVVNVFGLLAQRMNMMMDYSGGTSTEQLGATIDQLVADRSVKAIVLNADSPGGSTFGFPELGD